MRKPIPSPNTEDLKQSSISPQTTRTHEQGSPRHAKFIGFHWGSSTSQHPKPSRNIRRRTGQDLTRELPNDKGLPLRVQDMRRTHHPLRHAHHGRPASTRTRAAQEKNARAATAKATPARLSAPRCYPATTRATTETPQRIEEAAGSVRKPGRRRDRKRYRCWNEPQGNRRNVLEKPLREPPPMLLRPAHQGHSGLQDQLQKTPADQAAQRAAQKRRPTKDGDPAIDDRAMEDLQQA